jgi:DNA-binding MarR family transcriptional regulator
MTLPDLTRLATVANQRLDSPERADARKHLPTIVLLYVDQIREAEKCATPAQRTVLDYFERYVSEHKMSPTQQECADALGRSKVTVHEHIHALIGKRLLTRESHGARGVVLVR